MKKTIAILIALMLMLSVLPMATFAAEEENEMIPVMVYVPEGWDSPNLWAWADDGTNAFASWPGEAMVEGEDGWFTAKAPTWINSLIINGNDGTVQTADISIEAKELWITVYEDLTYELSYEDPNKAVEPITVHAKVPSDWSNPCCWAWSAPDGTNAFTTWPGEALTQDGEWYTIEVHGWINSVIINANEGTVQTADLSVEAGKDVWVVVTHKDNVSISYEEPSGDVTPPTTEPGTNETNPPATEPQPTEPGAADDQPNNTGLIIGIIAAVVVVIAVVVIIIKKKK